MSIHSRSTPITATDKATAINIATWLLAIMYLIMYLSRQSIKFVVLRKVQLDDGFMLAATICAIGLSIATSFEASNGLGKDPSVLNSEQIRTLQKVHFTTDLLYISSLCFAKLALLTFFHGLGINKNQRRSIKFAGLFVLVWSFIALIAAAFQCGLPDPWAVFSNHCFDTKSFWAVYGTIDIATDLGIVAIAVLMVYDLHVALSRKFAVIGCFAPRILVVAAAISRLVFLIPLSNDDGLTFSLSLWVPAICTQVQICMSIVTACIPYMKPFFEGVESGVWRTDDLRRRGLTIDDLTRYGSGYIKSPGETAKEADAYTLSSGVKIKIGTPTPIHSPKEKHMLSPTVKSLSSTRATTPAPAATPNRERGDSISYESEGSESRIIPDRNNLSVFPKH